MSGEGDSDAMTPLLDLGEFCDLTVVMALLFEKKLIKEKKSVYYNNGSCLVALPASSSRTPWISADHSLHWKMHAIAVRLHSIKNHRLVFSESA